ncbi:amylo-alpha-1,6-glucosidase [Nakamurella antarctica]|uniref:Amylo-alpha-1,6-glucosidase n=1 Tax=Nakamurella antarctica TaxID=1902245 RepID=A0A3G8ZHX9_9ACTN|nr:glycogen debranching N-terminal domain-containing protein [Nakamurella antarctica]AZI56969.1 amylo-alpha-1,6-glucosidase [Nakamurella antarctica]
MTQQGLQPFLHDLVTCLAAPTVSLSGKDGQIHPVGAQGIFAADLRAIGQAVVSVSGAALEPVSHQILGAAEAEFVAVTRSVEDPTPDPIRWLRRRRKALATGCQENFVLHNAGFTDWHLTLELRLATDLADMEMVKSGLHSQPRTPVLQGTRALFAAAQTTVWVQADDADLVIEGNDVVATWNLFVPARSARSCGWSVEVADDGAAVTAPLGAAPFTAPHVMADDRRLAPLITTSIADLKGLRLCTGLAPNDEFFAAGSPWYLTLFGRDSIWAARMLLPLGTEMALGTLRTLAAYQGTSVVLDTAEEPGKIPHELRRAPSEVSHTFLPPLYYGTIDATPLWICLLHDAWRWGLADEHVRELLPAAEAALAWLANYGDSDGDGFLEYIDRSGRGLTNQGWKDSGDSVRFADGRIAEGPVALVEVQGYAYQAAIAGAALLEAFGRPGASQWLAYAARLKAAVHQSFWTSDERGSYLGIALDGHKQLVDSVTSNMGHLLGTGILDPAEAIIVADRMVDPTMATAYGLRTMSSTGGGYSELSYHCGSVWPHDTAIVIDGMTREGLIAQAAVLTEGLLTAGTAFYGRMPELFGVFDDTAALVPYSASCRPQAWSAASAAVLLQSILGLRVDVPGETMTLNPSPSAGSLSVDGLKVAGHSFGVRTSPLETTVVGDLPTFLVVKVG